jgi:alanyl-tRNA synthetase
MDGDDTRKAHTGEHVLFRALSTVFEGLRVKKVELGKRNYFVIQYDGEITRDGILQAEHAANRIVSEGRPVTIHSGTKDEVSRLFPDLRVRWDRITDKVITVVCVQDFDWAACSGDHVTNTREIEFILVTRITSLGQGLYEIEFAVGENAKTEALHRSALSMEIAAALHTSLDSIIPTIINLKNDQEKLTEQVRTLTRHRVEQIVPAYVGDLALFADDLSGSDRKILQKSAAQLTRDGKNLVLFCDLSHGSFIVAARSPSVRVDCRELIQQVLPGSKGGGKPEYALAYSPTPIEMKTITSSLIQYLERGGQE